MRHPSATTLARMFAVVLVHPEIPPNTGNVIRLTANTATELHLVEPLGFRMDDRELKRAGLDYHEYARVAVHRDFAACRAALDRDGARRWFALTTDGTRSLYDARFLPGDVLVFGCETAGPAGRDRRASSRRTRACASRCGPACAASTCPTPSRWPSTKRGGSRVRRRRLSGDAIRSDGALTRNGPSAAPRAARAAAAPRRRRAAAGLRSSTRYTASQIGMSTPWWRGERAHGARRGDAFGDMAQLGEDRRQRLPCASASPTRRLRDRSPVQVSTRSPRPARPISVSRLPPSAADSRPVSARPRVISAARALWPKPRPSHAPAAMASTFLTAPPISTPAMSSLS